VTSEALIGLPFRGAWRSPAGQSPWVWAHRSEPGRVLPMECVIETKTNTILQVFDGLRGDVRITFEEGTWAA